MHQLPIAFVGDDDFVHDGEKCVENYEDTKNMNDIIWSYSSTSEIW